MLIKRLDRLATGRQVIAALVVVLALSLPRAALQQLTRTTCRSGGHGLLDLAGRKNALTFPTRYTPDDAYALLTHWGTVGRHDQLHPGLTLDEPAPPATRPVPDAWCWEMRLGDSPWTLAASACSATAYCDLAFDYGENVAILAMVLGDPEPGSMVSRRSVGRCGRAKP